MRIDSHQHFWKYDKDRDSWMNESMAVLKRDYLPEELIPQLSELNISGTVAVQADQSYNENNFLISLSKAFPVIKGVVGWVDFRSRDLTQRLEMYREHSVVKGFRHIIQSEPAGFMTDSNFINGVKEAGRSGFTYDLLIYHHQLKEALAFVHALGDIRIVVDHLAKPDIRSRHKTHWELNMAALASFPNVYCKVSGMVTEANWKSWTYDDFVPYLDELMETFGPERLMYGSDWPVCLLAASYHEQFEIVKQYFSSLSLSEQERIFGGTAAAFYKL